MEKAYLNDMDEYYSAKVKPRFGKRGPSSFSQKYGPSSLKIVSDFNIKRMT